MARSLDDAEFWLPSQFLTDDDVLMDKENFNKNGVNGTGFGQVPGLGFPTEFPYEFDSFCSNSALGSPVDSSVGLTETESSDEEDFLVGLTRRLAHSTLHETQKLAVPGIAHDKPEMVLSGSPQSTLSGIGSWSGRSTISSNGSPNGPSQVPSPPTTPFGANNDTWDLISAAAGQVARLKMSGEGTKFSHHHSRGLLCPPRRPNPSVPFSVRNPSNTGLYTNHANQGLTQNLTQIQHARAEQTLKSQLSGTWGRQVKVDWSAPQQQQDQHQQQIQNRARNSTVGYENGRCGRPVSATQSAWPSMHVQHLKQHHQHNNESAMRAVLLGGSGVKRECSGTGVFLPRRYGNPQESRKKTTGCPTVLLPARVVQALNLNFDAVKNGYSQQRFSSGFTPDLEAMVARRNALLAQQRPSLRPEGSLNHEVHLPQEWTY
ncbi:hypothetical protein FNV43_RR24686 [Rhamnella rubrinervis]|uniref:TIP41-like protein n=1 Tax=Rhamnella rubrinervis TaxID=2594499 RepID=A0A8K0GPC9_9ROSA|nr:hypothetical protein FNV43_RR24686 [Rhamnella rubrinervis]